VRWGEKLFLGFVNMNDLDLIKKCKVLYKLAEKLVNGNGQLVEEILKEKDEKLITRYLMFLSDVNEKILEMAKSFEVIVAEAEKLDKKSNFRVIK